MKDSTKTILSGVAGLAVGFGAGYFSVRQHYRSVYGQMAAVDIKKAQDTNRDVNQAPEDIPDITEEEYVAILSEMQTEHTEENIRKLYHMGIPIQQLVAEALYAVNSGAIRMAPEDSVESDEPVETVEEVEETIEIKVEGDDPEAVAETVTNIFEAQQTSWMEDAEYLEELNERHPSHPYVISVDEFHEEFANSSGQLHDKLILRYYDGDGNLADESNQIVPDVERVVGHSSLTKFGKFSRDTNVVYVRNESEAIHADFEVQLDERSYDEVVLNIRDRSQIPRMREDD